MKITLNKLIILLLFIINSTCIFAQEEEPTEPLVLCSCNSQTGSEHSCENLNSFSLCGSSNFDFEDPQYFDKWKVNIGSACFIGSMYTMPPTPLKNHFSFHLVDDTYIAYDPYVNIMTRSPLGRTQGVRIGNDKQDGEKVEFLASIEVERDNPYLTLLFAAVLENPRHLREHQPAFLIDVWNKANCSNTVFHYDLAAGDYGMDSINNISYKPWTKLTLDMKAFFQDFNNNSSEEFIIKYAVSDCKLCGHWGYAYIDGVCGNKIIPPVKEPDPDPIYPGDPEPEPWPSYVTRCIGSDISFSEGGLFEDETLMWDFGDGKGWSTEKSPTYYYSEPGIYKVTCTIASLKHNYGPVVMESLEIKIMDCCSLENAEKIQKENCITDFSPVEGEEYILQAWVKEGGSGYGEGITDYIKPSPHIKIEMANGASVTVINCFPSGPVIDGWQRIEKEFEVPSCPNGKIDFSLVLQSLTGGSESTYFDDIKVFPKRGGMKAYVYDPASQKLVSELDEENFATFYEYDKEGALIRVKKETERGIKTIKEAGNNTSDKTVEP